MTLTDLPLRHETPPARRTRKRTRIQAENEARILDAALAVFSATGYRGATLAEVAERAGMTKPNLLYYFRRKEDIYLAVLTRTLEHWLAPLRDLNADGEPVEEIRAYIRRKLQLARDFPKESQLFANEVLHGAPNLMPVLRGPLKDQVDEKAAVIRGWIADGRLTPVDPHHLIFMIWATTQHYADFAPQVGAVLGSNDWLDEAAATLDAIFVGGLTPR